MISKINLKSLAEAIVNGNKKMLQSTDPLSQLPNGSRAYFSRCGDFFYHHAKWGNLQGWGEIKLRLENENGPLVWAMAYSEGFTEEGITLNYTKRREVLLCLEDSLKKMPKEAPFRGPRTKIYATSGTGSSYGNFYAGYPYYNDWTGDLTRFHGEDYINRFNISAEDWKKVFSTNYAGGVIIQPGVEFAK